MTDDLSRLRPRRPARPARRARLPADRAVRGRGPRPASVALPGLVRRARDAARPRPARHPDVRRLLLVRDEGVAGPARPGAPLRLRRAAVLRARSAARSAGAYVRDAMERMRAVGYPVVGAGDAGAPPDRGLLRRPARPRHDQGRDPRPRARSSSRPPGTSRGSARSSVSCPSPTRRSAGTRSSPTAGTPGASACATRGAPTGASAATAGCPTTSSRT